jgi:hypothetical protein
MKKLALLKEIEKQLQKIKVAESKDIQSIANDLIKDFKKSSKPPHESELRKAVEKLNLSKKDQEKLLAILQAKIVHTTSLGKPLKK